jgi:hypothetical protein
LSDRAETSRGIFREYSGFSEDTINRRKLLRKFFYKFLVEGHRCYPEIGGCGKLYPPGTALKINNETNYFECPDCGTDLITDFAPLPSWEELTKNCGATNYYNKPCPYDGPCPKEGTSIIGWISSVRTNQYINTRNAWNDAGLEAGMSPQEAFLRFRENWWLHNGFVPYFHDERTGNLEVPDHRNQEWIDLSRGLRQAKGARRIAKETLTKHEVMPITGAEPPELIKETDDVIKLLIDGEDFEGDIDNAFDEHYKRMRDQRKE